MKQILKAGRGIVLGMPITSPNEIAVLLTLGAIVLLAVTSLLFCLQRPGNPAQPVVLRTTDRAKSGGDD